MRSQLADALFPIYTGVMLANYLQINLQWELRLPIAETGLRHKSYVKPLARWPHLEVFQVDLQDSDVMQMWSSSPLEAYGPDDMA